MANIYYTTDLDNFLNKNSLSSKAITSINSDSLVEDGSLTQKKIANLVVDTIDVSTQGYIRSGKLSFTDTVNTGWWLSSAGIYFGKASDATKFKFTVADGSLSIVGVTIDGTSVIGGRIASVLSTAIDASGHFADDAINTANNTILDAFTFGASGAIQIGTYVNGVTGDIRISPTGILGRDNTGATTFSINATTGVAVLNGLVVGTNVGLGTAQDSSGVTTIIGNTVNTSFVNALNITAASMSVGGLTSGTISSKAILLGITNGTGDSYIAGGNNLDLSNWIGGDVNGGAIILGLDDSDADKGKFFVGNYSTFKFFKFDGVDAYSTGIKYVESFVAGENIADGDVVCIKPSYTDYIPSDDTYTNQAAGDTNYGTEETCKIGQDGGGNVLETWLKWNVSTMPSAENILKAELIVYERVYTSGPTTIYVKRVTGGDWAEGTLTYNTKPAITDDLGSLFGMPTSYSTSGNGSKTIDITQLVRQWKGGAINNYGINLYGSNGASTNYDIDSSETSQGASFRPRIRIYTTDTSETGIYKANCSDYMLSRCIVGVAQETKNATENIIVQTIGKVDNLNLGSSTGGKAYLNNTAGSVVMSTNNLNRVIRIGKIISSNICLLDIQDEGVLIEKLYNPITSTGTVRFYAPIDARFARVYFNNSAGTEQTFYTDMYRDNDGLDSYNFATKVAGTYWNFTWGANYIEINNRLQIDNIYFYT